MWFWFITYLFDFNCFICRGKSRLKHDNFFSFKFFCAIYEVLLVQLSIRSEIEFHLNGKKRFVSVTSLRKPLNGKCIISEIKCHSLFNSFTLGRSKKVAIALFCQSVILGIVALLLTVFQYGNQFSLLSVGRQKIGIPIVLQNNL